MSVPVAHTPDVHAPAPRRTWSSGWSLAAIAAVVIAAVVAVVVIAHAAHGLSFFFDDEWSTITQRRNASLDDFLRPHGGHLMILSVVIYNVLFRTVGLRSYAPYLGVLIGLHVITCGLLFVYLRRRAPVVYAVLATILLLFLGAAWQDLLWAFQITYLLSLATGLAALLLLERRDRVGDWLALVALVLSVASSGAGLVFASGAVIELAWTARDRRRLWVAVTPIAAWVLWYFAYGSSRGSTSNVIGAPSYMLDLAGSALGALTGASLGVGTVVAVVATVLVGVTVVRAWPISGRFASCIAMAYGLWILLAYSRDPRVPGTESRYIYLGAVFVLLLGAELIASWPPIRLPVPVAVIGGLVLLALVGNTVRVNIDALHSGAADLRLFATDYQARWSAFALLGDRVDRNVKVGHLAESTFTAGEVLDAVHALHYPLLTADDFRHLPPGLQTGGDFALAQVFGLAYRRVPPKEPSGTLPIEAVTGATADADGRVHAVHPDRPRRAGPVPGRQHRHPRHDDERPGRGPGTVDRTSVHALALRHRPPRPRRLAPGDGGRPVADGAPQRRTDARVPPRLRGPIPAGFPLPT